MQAFKWLCAASAATLLGTCVGCTDQDSNPEAETTETQPAETFDAEPGVLDAEDENEASDASPTVQETAPLDAPEE